MFRAWFVRRGMLSSDLSFLLIILFLVNIASISPSLALTTYSFDTISLAIDPVKIIMEVNEIYAPKILEHAIYLSSLESRFSGYKGNEMAAEYIYQKFREYNASKVWFETFKVTIPLDLGTNITVILPENGEKIIFPAYALYPNGVQTCIIPEEGITGVLIYGGSGSLEDLQGKNMEGSIVVLEFNSGWNWRLALSLGAKAVIFLENNDMTRFEAETKYSGAPIYFPRLFVESKYADHLRTLAEKGNVIATLRSSVFWREVESRNILAFIEGTAKKNSTIVLMAHYDSFSVVPCLSPGASESFGIASLIELANFFSLNKPIQNILLVATSGHHQGLVGSREFVERHFNELGSKFVLAISLDISYETNVVAIRTGLGLGSFYQYDLVLNWDVLYNYIIRKIGEYNKVINENVKKKYNVFNVRTAPNMHEPFAVWLDSEPFAIAARGGGFGLCTYSVRPYFKSPGDTIDKLKDYSISNIIEQIEYIYSILYMFSQEPVIYTSLSPIRFSDQNYGFITIRGRVWEYNITTGWYEWSHGKAIIHAVRLPTMGGAATYQQTPYWSGTSIGAGALGAGLNTFIMTDEDGTFSIIGIQPGSTMQLYAYLIDEKTGRILYSIETGVFKGSGQGGSFANPFIVGPMLEHGEITVTVFKSASIAFTLANNPLNYIWESNIVVGVNNFYSHMPPVFSGTVIKSGMDIVAFIPAEENIELIFYANGQFISCLVNASRNNMMGTGYMLKNGEQLIIPNLPLVAFENLWFITEFRLKTAHKSGLTYSETAAMYHNWATLLLLEAKDDLKNKNYALAHYKIMKGWSYEISAYRATLTLIKDSINTSVFFFLLLMPFTLLFQTLVFETKSGTRQLQIIIASFLILLGALCYFHPGFSIATNIFAVLIGVSVSLFCLISIFLIFQESSKYLRELAIREMGYHQFEIDRLSAIFWAVKYGVSAMKKRKMRTSLTLFTVATICFSMVSFTSMSIITSPRATKRSLEYINYNGIYIRKSVWGAPAQTFSPLLYYDLYYDILEEIKSNNAVISPRIWIYPSMTKIPICYNNEVSLNLRFLIGLTPKEKDISFIDIKYGYWFAEDGSDANICIINENLALQLGIDPEKIAKGEKVCVNIWGLPFRIVGIVDTNMLSLIINPDAEAGGFMPAEIGGYEGTHASPDSIVIIPFGTAMRILGGGYINSLGGIFNIVIKFSNITQDQILNYVTNLCYRFSLQIYAVYNGTVWFYTMYTAPVFFGWESLLVVFLISALIILSTMLGNVEERKREIQIYGTIGLNPLHVGGIFLAESLVYSIIGSVFGYFSGITIVLTINNFQGPVLPANFSSIFVVLAVLIAITTMICSSGYAVWLASKMTTPSIERRWRPPTKPRGDEWLIPLPFRFSEKELWGLFAYLIEYIEQHRYERIGYFQALDLRYKEELHEKTEERGLVMKVKLAPWDLPTFQLVNLRAIRYLDEETYQIFLHIIRESGFLETWMTSNYVFISDLRKQLLLWRSLSPNEKKAYVDIGARKLKLLYSGELDEKP